jgi:DNA-binding CsgD family transcriptional regulator
MTPEPIESIRAASASEALALARAAFDRRAWREVADRLGQDQTSQPRIEDLERLATAQQMLGEPDDARATWERAHFAALAAGDPVRASRNAFHLVMNLFQRGESAQASGWQARAMRLLDDAGSDCVERGLLRIPEALQALNTGDMRRSLAVFEELGALAERFGDRDAFAMACLGQGQSLIAMGEVDRGIALLDEAMVAVTTDDVSPLNVGIVYCASIEAYQSVFDLGRAQEWTTALGRWCDSQPDAVPFRGRCLVFRSELLLLHGLWQDALAEVGRAHDWLSRPPIEPSIGEAHYQRAELHRLRGSFAEAEEEYAKGATWGRRPDPGFALLRLAQGDRVAALAAIRRALDEADPTTRSRLLGPSVEILIAVGHVDDARAAADELAALAVARPDRRQPPMLRAIANRADGLVRLASGDVRGALAALRRAADLWRSLDAPYELARVRVSIALSLRELGDRDSASIELAAARETFGRLEAAPDLARLETLEATRQVTPGGLSARESEVLANLARGATNRQIAAKLGISERTVDRHVSNIFTKLDVSTRAAATAFAFEHRLL